MKEGLTLFELQEAREEEEMLRGSDWCYDVDWEIIKQDFPGIEINIKLARLSPDERYQAKGIMSAIKILADLPRPPVSVIRALLYDLAAISAILSVALQLADSLRK